MSFPEIEVVERPHPAALAPGIEAVVPIAPFQECEIKLDGPQESLDSAFASLMKDAEGAAPARNLSSVYFDTPGSALWSRGIVLRVRKSQGRFIQTLKWSDGPNTASDTRNELEVKCPGGEPEIDLFGQEVAAELQLLTGGAPLIPHFSTQIRRRTIDIAIASSKIEVALDIGNIIDGKSKVPVREIELELKQGEAADLYAFAEQLSAAYNLRLGLLTKSQRGFGLAADDKIAVRRAQSPPLDSDMRLDDLIGASLTECLDHFVLNWPALLQSDNAEAIHQMRVGIRRLRAVLKLFHRTIPHPKFLAFRTDGKEIAAALGDARDTDVFISMLERGPFKYCAHDESVDAFIQAAQERREEGYGRAHAMLAAPQTTRFVLELRSFIARHGWQEGLEAQHLMSLGQPAAKLAAHALHKLDRKARKSGQTLEAMSGELRHELRIILKNIRYCAELFRELFEHPGTARKYVRVAGQFQDALGVFNDGLVANTIIADIERRAGPKSARAAGIVTGWTARGQAEADAGLIDQFNSFKKVKRFWDRTRK